MPHRIATESIALRKWVDDNHPRRLIIPTDLFHTRRVRWLFRKALKKTDATVMVEPVPSSGYAASNWWQREEGLIAFQNEILKSAYYHLRY